MRTKLIEGLKKAIYALQKDTVIYNWKKQYSCNCGVVAQAMTDLPPQQISKKFTEMRELYETVGTQEKFSHTWREGVQYTCSVTGKTQSEILTRLMDAGLLPEDIIHLEYLDNLAILAESGINVEPTYNKKITKEMVKKDGWWNRFRGIEVEQETTETTKIDYYQKKENLILYLQAWLRILGRQPIEKPIEELSKVELQEQLLRCEHAENYEEAAILRDLISAA